jgi:hypothetical protein
MPFLTKLLRWVKFYYDKLIHILYLIKCTADPNLQGERRRWGWQVHQEERSGIHGSIPSSAIKPTTAIGIAAISPQ